MSPGHTGLLWFFGTSQHNYAIPGKVKKECIHGAEELKANKTKYMYIHICHPKTHPPLKKKFF